ncbi:MAG: hypothetical protein H7831_03990 [Magnetococcus sp. WYHC-3]
MNPQVLQHPRPLLLALWALVCGIALFRDLPLVAHPAAVHALLALGVVPLILGAMLFFIPTLTRTRPASSPLTTLPLLAAGAGALVVWMLDHDRRVLPLAALLLASALVGMLAWIQRRRRMALGGSHPALRWYQAALSLLLLGIGLIVLGWALPEHFTPLRSAHLHVNLVGFLGMTAVGTLQTLLPTITGHPDPQAAQRLHRDWWPALLGTLAAALGALVNHAFSLVGMVLWLWVVVRLARPTLALGAKVLLPGHGAFPLLVALAGFLFIWLAGPLIALGMVDANQATPAFLFAFLFPLISGALAYLAPLWRWNPREDALQRQARRTLTWSAGAGAPLHLMAALGPLAGWDAAAGLAPAALGLFLATMVVALRPRPSLQPVREF